MTTIKKLSISALSAIILSIGLTLALPSFSPDTNTASANPILNLIRDGTPAGTTDTDSAGTVQDIVRNVLTAVFFMAGVLAVVLIVIGGIRYSSSAGDANKIATAKSTILYSVIGLVFCIAALAIVQFIFSRFANTP